MINDRYCHGEALQQRIETVERQYVKLCEISPPREHVGAFNRRHEKIVRLKTRLSTLLTRAINERKG